MTVCSVNLVPSYDPIGTSITPIIFNSDESIDTVRKLTFIVYITEGNQEKIVEAGGLTSLLMLLRTYEDETIRRIAAGAIANLAMNGMCCSLCLVLLSFICQIVLFLRIDPRP